MVDVNQAVIIPAPPRPPAAPPYDSYFNELNRWFEVLTSAIADAHYLRATGLYFATIPTSGYGLRAGEVFSNAGVLTVVRENDIWLGSQSATTGLGTLTVTP